MTNVNASSIQTRTIQTKTRQRLHGITSASARIAAPCSGVFTANVSNQIGHARLAMINTYRKSGTIKTSKLTLPKHPHRDLPRHAVRTAHMAGGEGAAGFALRLGPTHWASSACMAHQLAKASLTGLSRNCSQTCRWRLERPLRSHQKRLASQRV